MPLFKQKFKRFAKEAVPGLVTGGADNDPSGITTYSISGASFGFSQLWLMVLATPMLVAVQSMCSRIAHVKRKGLATVLREHLSPSVAWVATAVLAVSNTVTIGADLLAISLALELLTGVSLRTWMVPVTVVVWYVVLFLNYRTINRFLLIMLLFFGAYLLAAVLAGPDWGQVFRSLVWPDLSGAGRGYAVAAVAVLGTTITPYLFFWQVKQELEEKKRREEMLAEAKHEDSINAPGYVFSQIITLSIIVAAAVSTPGDAGIRTVADAARALQPVAGSWATSLFALGVIGAGLLAVPVLAVSTASAVAESAHFRHEGLSNQIRSAKGFYAVVTLSLLAGVSMLLLNVDTLKALYYSQFLAGLLAPILLLAILVLTNRKSVMGEYTNGWFDNFFGTLAFAVMAVAGAIALFG